MATLWRTVPWFAEVLVYIDCLYGHHCWKLVLNRDKTQMKLKLLYKQIKTLTFQSQTSANNHALLKTSNTK